MKLNKQFQQFAKELETKPEVMGLLRSMKGIAEDIEKLSGWHIDFKTYKKQAQTWAKQQGLT